MGMYVDSALSSDKSDSMTLYNIDKSIRELFDEDGELEDIEKFETLLADRNKKIEGIACYIKELAAFSEALKAEEASLKERRQAADNKAERLKELLKYALDGEKFETPKVKVSFRASERCVPDDEFVTWAEENCLTQFIRYTPRVDKATITKYLKAGNELEHVRIETVKNVTVK